MKPGTVLAYLKRWNGECLPIIGKYGKLVGCWQTESGKLNSVLFIWGYESFGHREEQHKKLKADHEWKNASSWVGEYIVQQDSIFLILQISRRNDKTKCFFLKSECQKLARMKQFGFLGTPSTNITPSRQREQISYFRKTLLSKNIEL
jgi:hypothetical protein